MCLSRRGKCTPTIVGRLSRVASEVLSGLFGPRRIGVSVSGGKLIMKRIRSKGATGCANLVYGTTSTNFGFVVMLTNVRGGLEDRARDQVSRKFLNFSARCRQTCSVGSAAGVNINLVPKFSSTVTGSCAADVSGKSFGDETTGATKFGFGTPRPVVLIIGGGTSMLGHLCG